MRHMPTVPTIRRLGWLPTTLLVVAVTVLVVASAVLALRAANELRGLRSNSSDNILWNLSQLELELSTLQRLTVESRLPDGRDVADDVAEAHAVYLRHLDMLLQNRLYRGFLQEVEALDEVTALSQLAGRLAPPPSGATPPTPAATAERFALLEQSRDIMGAMTVDVALRVADRDAQAGRQVLDLLRSLSLFPFLLLALLAVLGGVTYRLFHILRLQSEQARQTLERLGTIIGTSRDAIAVTDPDGRLVEFNAAAEALFGTTRSAALGRQISTFLSDIGTRGADGVLCGSGKRSDGTSVPLELTAGVGGSAGQDVIVYVMRDIRHRLKIEEDLRNSRDRALAGERAKARFLAVMSHEMRTPLHGILGAIGLLRAEAQDPVVHRYIGILEGSGEILLSHINDVLDISRIEADGIPINTAPVDLSQLSDALVRGLAPLAQLRSVTLARRLHFPGGAQVVTDPGRLRQVLLNLLDNAIKHSSEGEVALDLSLSDSGPAPVLEIQITDTGPGIATDQTERIFEDFVRLGEADSLQVEGSGLGLGITRRIVKAMGGEIGVDSEPGAGSLFWVRLPVTRRAAGVETTVPSEGLPLSPSPVAPQSVLLVEDNAVNRLILHEMLRRDLHEVDEASNGAEGVKRAAARRYDLILMDISMPVMDGVSASRAIRAGGGASAGARIVALTAHVTAADDDRLIAAGIDAVVTKPLTWDGLRAILRGDCPAEARTSPVPALLDGAVFATVLGAIGLRDMAPHLAQFRADGEALCASLAAGQAPDPAAVHALAGAAATLGARRLHAFLGGIEMGSDAAGVAPLWQDTLAAVDAAYERGRARDVDQIGT